MHPSARPILRSLSLAIALSLVYVTPSFATPNIAPDPDATSGANDKMGYAVARADYIDLQQTQLKIYSVHPKIAVFVLAADLCRPMIGGIEDNKHSPAIDWVGPNVKVTDYQLTGSGAQPTDNAAGRNRADGDCPNNTNVPAAGTSNAVTIGYNENVTRRLVATSTTRLEGNNNYYVYDLTVQRVSANCNGSNCFLNSFRIHAVDFETSPGSGVYGDGGGTYVSQDPDYGANQFALKPGSAAGDYDHSVYFGPNCSATAPTFSDRIVIYDDDNINDNFTQPTDKPFRIRIETRARNSGDPWVGLPLTATSSAWTNQSSQVPEDDNNANNGPGAPAVGDGTKRYYRFGYGDPERYVLGTNQSGQTIEARFGMNIDNEYRMRLLNVYYHNNIQFKVPYPTIWADIRCQVPVQPIVSMPSEAVIGDTITPTYTIRNNLSGRPYDTQVNYLRRLWYANNNNGVVDAGETVVSADPGFQGPQNVNDGNSVTLGSFPTIANSARYLCASLELAVVDPNSGLIAANSRGDSVENPDYACTSIGKYPSLGVGAGDVRTGGAVVPGSCTITTPTGYTQTQNARHYGIIGHNYAAQTAATPYHTYLRHAGFITGVGYDMSTNTAGPSGTNQSLIFANNGVPSGGGPMGGQFHGELPNMAGVPVSGYKTHCLSPVFTAGRFDKAGSDTPISGTTDVALTGAAGTTLRNYVMAPGSTLNLTGPGGGPLMLSQGQSMIIRVTGSGTVRLGSNVEFTGTSPNIHSLPRFVLLVGDTPGSQINIRVADGVTRLDGIYANQGTNDGAAAFHTCETKATNAQITAGQCQAQLKVNGAIIIGSRLNPYRTAGHGDRFNTDPAELFTLRPDVILSDYARDDDAPRLEMVNQRELAPRF